MKRSRIRMITAWILIAVMCMSSVPASAFAEEQRTGETKNIVVLGNSTASGYGMPDSYAGLTGFSLRNNDLDHYSLEEAMELRQGRLSGSAYPYRLKRYIAENEFGGDMDRVKLTAFTLNGMRVDEALALIDEDFYRKETAREAAYSEKWKETHTPQEGKSYLGFLTARMNRFISALYNGGAASANDYKAANEYVRGSVEDADVIVLDACNNNFGTYIGYRLAAYSGIGYTDSLPNIYETIDDVDGLPEWLRSAITGAMEKAEKSGIMKDAFARQIVDAYMYAAASCIVNYSAAIEEIRKINPDAKLICVGISNPNKDMAVLLGETRVELGAMLGRLFSLVDLYIRCLDKNSDNIYYADLPGDLSSIGASISNKDTLEEVFADGPEDGFRRDGDGSVMVDEFGNKLTDARSNYGIHQMFQREDGSGFNNDYLNGMFTKDPETGGETFYKTVLAPAFLAKGITLKDWDELDDGDIITGTMEGVPAPLYVTFDFSTADVAKALNADMTGNSHPAGKIGKAPGAGEDDPDDTTVYLTKANVDKAVYRVYDVLYEGVCHSTIDVSSVASMMADRNSMSLDLIRFIFGAADRPADDTLGLLYMLVRFVMADAIGEHPDSEGLEAKYEAVLAAYVSDTTAAEEVKDAVRARLGELYARILEIAEEISKAAGGPEIAELIEEMEQIMIELKEIGAALYRLPEYEKAVDAYAETFEKFAGDIADLQDKIESIGQQSAELAAQMEKLEGDAEELKGLITDAQEKNKALEQQVDVSGEEIERLNALISGIQERMVNYEFTQAKVSLKKVKAAKKSFTAAWKALDGAEGYQVSYKLGKKTVKKTVAAAKTSLKVKKLKKGRKYTVKVRAYRVSGGRKIYSKWSSGKKVKVK